MKIIKICKICGEEFKPSKQQLVRKQGRCCSIKCRTQYCKLHQDRYLQYVDKIKTSCVICGKIIWVSPSNIKRGKGKYCSPKCQRIAFSDKIKMECKYCKKEFLTIQSKIQNGRKYCSKKCADMARHKDKVKRICVLCNKEFYVHENIVQNGKGIYCSLSCKSIANIKNTKYQNTNIEIIIETLLKKKNIIFIKQHYIEQVGLVDFFIPIYNLIIETDGDFWHGTEKQKQKDINRDFKAIIYHKYNTIRLSEKLIISDLYKCWDKIQAQLKIGSSRCGGHHVFRIPKLEKKKS